MRTHERFPTKQAVLPLSSTSYHPLLLTQMSAATLSRQGCRPSSHQSYRRDPWLSGTSVLSSEPSRSTLSRGGRTLRNPVVPPFSRRTKIWIYETRSYLKWTYKSKCIDRWAHMQHHKFFKLGQLVICALLHNLIMLGPAKFLRKFIEINGAVFVCIYSGHQLINLFWADTQIKLPYSISKLLGGYLTILVWVKLVEYIPHGSRRNLE